ncbi:MAG: OmpH family outer membrane protein [Rubellimicrobium sp.]|nr:OmpH family outer membrane protein [Rubellimicrobium sp.]
MALRAALAALALAAAPVAAQEAAPLTLGQVQSAVLTVDTDRLFSESLFGRRVADETRTATEALAAENRTIEAQLTVEEQGLTDRRPGMTPDAFRAEADAFDARVQAIRAEQDTKERALQDRLNAGRDAFLSAAAPVLGDLMAGAGASVILDRRSVFLALGAIDITDQAIAAIDAAIGDGATESGSP